MRVPAAILAVPCFAGCAAGVLLADAAEPQLARCAAAAACLALLAALAAFADTAGPEVAVAVALGAGFAGVSLGLSDARRAYSMPILRWFDACAGADREGPAVLDGVLVDDAAPTAYGATLTLGVARVASSACGGEVVAAG